MVRRIKIYSTSVAIIISDFKYNHGITEISGIRKVLNLGLKAEKQLQNENNTDDWELGSHPRIRPKILSLKSYTHVPVFFKYLKIQNTKFTPLESSLMY